MSYAAFYDHAVAEETDRLTALGDAINDETFRRLAQLGLRPDARCLDIGSGTGPIATRLCELCPDGEVVATDLAWPVGDLARFPDLRHPRPVLPRRISRERRRDRAHL